jgi:hypothetical protein
MQDERIAFAPRAEALREQHLRQEHRCASKSGKAV